MIKFERSVNDGILTSPSPNFFLFAQFIHRFYIFLIWAIHSANFFINSIHLHSFLFHWFSNHLGNSFECLNYEEDSFWVDLKNNSFSGIFGGFLHHIGVNGFDWCESHCFSPDFGFGKAFWAFDSHLLNAIFLLPLRLIIPQAYSHRFSSKALSFGTL